MKKFLVLILTLAMGLSCVSSISTMTFAETVSAIDSSNSDDWLHADGNKIVDNYGNQVWLTGCNWFGFNTGTNVFDGVWSCNMKKAIDGIANRGFNFLRIPISTQLICEWSAGNPPKANVNEYVNPELTGLNSLQLFDAAIEDCKEAGIKVMVDIHSAKTDAMGHTYPLWYNDTFSTETWISALEWMTNRYKNNDTIVAFDLKNEPHGTAGYNDPAKVTMAKWDNSTDENNWKYAAEVCAKRILKINPNILIMVEGVETYPKAGKDYTAIDKFQQESNYYFNWWGGNLRGVKDYPVNLGEYQKQLVYSPHDYGPLVYKQNWFYDGFNGDTLYKDCWGDNWGYIQKDGIAPILIGEWGGFLDGGDNEKWMTDLRDYIIANKVSHTFWCYNANSGDTGGLVGYDFSTWDEKKYEFLKPALWHDENGKFIGLDHKINLGANGTHVGAGVIPTILYGDLNGDKLINSVDVALMKRYVLGVITSFPSADGLKAADVNGDGTINTVDYSLMKRFSLGIINKFPIDK
jgi:endoglucanase